MAWRSHRRKSVLTASAWGALLLSHALAGAQPAPGASPEPEAPVSVWTEEDTTADRAEEAPTIARARELYRQASAIARAGAWSEARSLYQESYALFPRASTLYNIGYCTAQLGDPAAALYYVSRALDDQDPALPAELASGRRALAEQQRELLAAETAEVTLETPAGAIGIKVDGRALVRFGGADPARYTLTPDAPPDVSELESGARIVLNPGAHRLELSIANRREVRVLHLARGQKLTLHWLEASAPGAASAPSSAGVTSRRAAPERATNRPAPTDDTASLYRIAGVSSLAVGGAGFVLAGVAGIVTWKTDEELEATCGTSGGCPPSESDAVDRYVTASSLTNLGLVVGAVGVGTGFGLLLTDHYRSEPSLSMRLEPGRVSLNARF